MDWTTFFQQCVNAFTLSGTYAIVAIGITLVFGLARLVNFAHTAFGILGAFVAWQLTQDGASFWPAFLGGIGVVGFLSYGLQKTVLQRTLSDPLRGFIISLGALLALQAFMINYWGADVRLIIAPFEGKWDIGGVIITYQRAFNTVFGFGVLGALLAVLKWTRFGRAVRALAEDEFASRVVGVDTNATVAAVFVLGTSLAAAGAILLGTISPFQPFSGNELLIKAFAITIVGGLGNVKGAMICAIALAFVETMGAAYWEPRWVSAYSLGFIAVILLIRPQGLFKSISWQEGF